MRPEQLVVSPCSNPEMQLDEALGAYAGLGFTQFEVFTSWAKSAFDYHLDPATYLSKGRRYGMAFTSFHLPPIKPGQPETLQEAIAAARFADALGVEVVLYKAADRPTYIAAAPEFLDATEALRVTPVIQNHFGTAISTLDDVMEVREGIADPRMHTLLEVGQFHSAGVDWREAAEKLGESISLVHIKDQVGRQSVPFGQGEVDLLGLFEYLDARGYTGRYVIEMEVSDKENTLQYLADARDYVFQYMEGAK
jgi:sugar phosphate isomerase/epimerase